MVERVVNLFLRVLVVVDLLQSLKHFYMQICTFLWTPAHILKFKIQSGNSSTIRESNQASGVRKVHYACSSILLAEQAFGKLVVLHMGSALLNIF